MAREMKDSGIEWIGEIPDEWKTVRFKFLHNGLNTGEAIDKQYWTDNINDIVFYTAGLTPIRTCYIDFPKWKYTTNHDLLLARNGTPYVYFPITNACYSDHIIRADIKGNINRRFVGYSLQRSISSVIVNTVSIPTWSASLWNEQIIPLPPLPEQHRIADFLDRKCAEIDRVLEKTRASIEEYKKLKQSVITQAVTKGVRGGREMKDSGIEWFRQIPVDVNISRVGYYYNVILGKMICSQPQEGMTEYPYFCAANIHYSGIDYNNLKRMWFSSNEIETYAVRNGDLLVVEGGAGAGGCAIVKDCNEVVGIQNSIQIVRPKHNHDIRYLAYLIQLLVKSQYIDVVCNKATIPHFTKDKLLTMPYLVFPINEQQEICNYLDKKCSEIDTLISKKEQFITELESYKKSLIYEYVTGKKEVQ